MIGDEKNYLYPFIWVKEFFMFIAGVVAMAITIDCTDPASTADVPEWPVDTVFVTAYEDSAAMGSCTLCNSQIATPYFCDYEECARLAHERGMAVCRWAQLDRIPEEWVSR